MIFLLIIIVFCLWFLAGTPRNVMIGMLLFLSLGGFILLWNMQIISCLFPFFIKPVIFIISLINTVLFLLISLFILFHTFKRLFLKQSFDYVVILGAQILNGKISPVLKSRLDQALPYAKNPHIRFVVSGGQGKDEINSEAQGMKNYLLKKGVSANNIILEDKSINTFENLKFSCAKINQDKSKSTNPLILVVTSDYHVFRTYCYAEQLKFKIYGVQGAKTTPGYFKLLAAIRELMALSVKYRFEVTLILLWLIISFKLGCFIIKH